MQIPGYRTSLSGKQVAAVIEACGYAHFEAKTIAPMDNEFFHYRQQNDAQAIPALVIASLLSKKISVSVERAGLDVRVSDCGNFGKNFDDAAANAKRFVRVAEILGLTATCVLTDGGYAYQPYLGRKESLLALNRVITGSACKWLTRHADQCKDLAAAVAGERSVGPGEIAKVFDENIVAQGGSKEALQDLLEKLVVDHRIMVNARQNGYVRYDLGRLRAAMVKYQNRPHLTSKYSDPVGIILKSEDGEYVELGQPILSIRNDFDDAELVLDVEACITFFAVSRRKAA
ncbi:MAG: hypothetical protein NVV72_10430 [Asticcacaulis sp.]|nr:hypothetical protein [Asticcacaulis sp.]